MVDNFKIIKEESFDLINPYLRLLYQFADGSYPFAFVTINGIDYMVTKIYDDRYAIAYKDKDNYLLFGSRFDNDNSYVACDSKIAYRLFENGDLIMEDQNNLFKQSMYIYESIESEPKMTFNYSQIDPLNKRDLFLHYSIEGYQDPKVALTYINNRIPKEVVINRYPFLLNVQMRYANCDNRYYRYYRVNDDIIRALPMLKNYNKDEMMEYIERLGFNSKVPNDFMQVYKDENSQVKVLKRVSEEYRKNTGL